jgi:hypothetical protein
LARDSGEAAEDLDSSAAVFTAAMVDGLMMHMLTDPGGITARDAVAALADHLRRYLRPTTTGDRGEPRHDSFPYSSGRYPGR